MIDLKSLETFVWVATLGSFRGAAAKLNTTQPAISQRIALLEADLGVKLLERGSRRVTTTAKGRELLGYADRMLALRAEMRHAMSLPHAVRGVLRLGASETIVHTWLPGFVATAARRWPELDIAVEVDVSPRMRERLIEKDLDLAFLLGPLMEAGLVNRLLSRFSLGFVAAPTLGLAGRRMPLAELGRLPFITFARGTEPYLLLRRLFSARGLPMPRLHASASLSSVVRLAQDGVGVAVIPPAVVIDDLASGRLHEVATDATLPNLSFVACWPASPDTRTVEAVASLAEDVARADDRARAELADHPALSPGIA